MWLPRSKNKILIKVNWYYHQVSWPIGPALKKKKKKRVFINISIDLGAERIWSGTYYSVVNSGHDFFKTFSLFFLLFFFIIIQFPVLKDSQNAHLQNVLGRLDTFAKVHTAPNSTFISKACTNVFLPIEPKHQSLSLFAERNAKTRFHPSF